MLKGENTDEHDKLRIKHEAALKQLQTAYAQAMGIGYTKPKNQLLPDAQANAKDEADFMAGFRKGLGLKDGEEIGGGTRDISFSAQDTMAHRPGMDDDDYPEPEPDFPKEWPQEEEPEREDDKKYTDNDKTLFRKFYNIYIRAMQNVTNTSDEQKAYTTTNGYKLGWNERPEITYDDDFQYDENRDASLSDSISWGWWGLKNIGAKVLRTDLDDATDAYSHFRNGEGADYRVDLGEGIREDAVIRSFVNEQIEGAKESAIELHEYTGLNEFVMTGSAVLTGSEYYPETEN